MWISTEKCCCSIRSAQKNSWRVKEYRELFDDVKLERERLMRRNRDLIIMGNFNGRLIGKFGYDEYTRYMDK